MFLKFKDVQCYNFLNPHLKLGSFVDLSQLYSFNLQFKFAHKHSHLQIWSMNKKIKKHLLLICVQVDRFGMSQLQLNFTVTVVLLNPIKEVLHT